MGVGEEWEEAGEGKKEKVNRSAKCWDLDWGLELTLSRTESPPHLSMFRSSSAPFSFWVFLVTFKDILSNRHWNAVKSTSNQSQSSGQLLRELGGKEKLCDKRWEEALSDCSTAPAEAALGDIWRLLCRAFSLPFSLDNLINYTDEVNQHQKRLWQLWDSPSAWRWRPQWQSWTDCRAALGPGGAAQPSMAVLIFTDTAINCSRQKMTSK